MLNIHWQCLGVGEWYEIFYNVFKGLSFWTIYKVRIFFFGNTQGMWQRHCLLSQPQSQWIWSFVGRNVYRLIHLWHFLYPPPQPFLGSVQSDTAPLKVLVLGYAILLPLKILLPSFLLWVLWLPPSWYQKPGLIFRHRLNASSCQHFKASTYSTFYFPGVHWKTSEILLGFPHFF